MKQNRTAFFKTTFFKTHQTKRNLNDEKNQNILFFFIRKTNSLQ